MTKRQHRLRRALITFVVVTLAFFLGGFMAVKLGWLSEGAYLTIATIAGGAASLIGVLSLARPSITTEDLEAVELEALGRVSQLTKELEEAKVAQAKTKGELEQLELQRAQMEASVRTAAMELFLREKIARQKVRLTEKLFADPELVKLIDALRTDYEQLNLLADEIEQDPNVQLLWETIHRVRLQQRAERAGRGVGTFLGRFEHAIREAAERLIGRM